MCKKCLIESISFYNFVAFAQPRGVKELMTSIQSIHPFEWPVCSDGMTMVVCCLQLKALKSISPHSWRSISHLAKTCWLLVCKALTAQANGSVILLGGIFLTYRLAFSVTDCRRARTLSQWPCCDIVIGIPGLLASASYHNGNFVARLVRRLINVAASNLPARQIRALSQSWQQRQSLPSHLALPFRSMGKYGC